MPQHRRDNKAARRLLMRTLGGARAKDENISGVVTMLRELQWISSLGQLILDYALAKTLPSNTTQFQVNCMRCDFTGRTIIVPEDNIMSMTWPIFRYKYANMEVALEFA